VPTCLERRDAVLQARVAANRVAASGKEPAGTHSRDGAGRSLRAVRSVAKLHIEDIPALAAGGLNDWRCGMLIGNSRDAISIDLPVTRRGAVGRQELRFRLRGVVSEEC